MLKEFFPVIFGIFFVNLILALYLNPILYLLIVFIPLILVVISDLFQNKQAVRRNFPIIGNLRYILESIRPEISQYFIETNSNGVPFSREQRSLVYQRSKKALQTLPFGTQKNVYETGYQWINHSLMPIKHASHDFRVVIGGEMCSKPYSASLFNISGMSYGALSKNAILALNGGAKMGNFAHNTGEGGLSPYHLEYGADVIWQIGTGYFGCRGAKGNFDEGLYQEKSNLDAVKMIELKLSQGAKPSHGGLLPAAKVTAEIAKIRNITLGQDVVSPPRHSAFDTPCEMLEFIEKLRHLSGGKPVGIKLCLGKYRDFMAIVKAMIQTRIYPDFITIDGGEGGTGAAPLEFSNSVGTPLDDGLVFIHNTLVGTGLRQHIKLIVSGKIITGFDIICKIALGADLCSSARSMMLALGCIQALRCNTNQCPVGVATQNPWLVRGLVITDKKDRVYNFHKGTLTAFTDILGAMGLESPTQIRPRHILKRVSYNDVKNYEQIHRFIDPGSILEGVAPEPYMTAWTVSEADSFTRVD